MSDIERMKIELLYFENCPGYEKALKNLRELLEEKELKEEIQMTEVTSDGQARELRFIGSPTIRINGKDVDEHVWSVKDNGMKCRIYLHEGKILGYPPKAMNRRAIEEKLRCEN